MKVRTNITVDKEVLEKAHELGINVSKACENCLKQYIAAIKSAKLTNGGKSFLSEASFTKEGSMVRSPGFEPGSSAWQADVLVQTRRRPHRVNFIFGFLFPFLKREHY